MNSVALGTYVNDVIIVELQEGAVETEVKSVVSNMDLGEKSIKIVDKIPRDPRHFSKIDYKKVIAIM